MRRLRKQGGSGLIVLLGIVATLAILAVTAVMLTQNMLHATAASRSRVSALNYAEAALSSGVLVLRTQTWPSASGSFSASDLASAYNATYSSGPVPTIQVYDNQNPVNKAITWDQGSSTSASTPDGELWVQASATYLRQTAVVRELVGQVNATGRFTLPAAVIYTDSNVVFDKGVGNAFAVDGNGNPDTSKSAGIYAGGNVTGNNSSSTFSPVSGGAATVSVHYNGSYTNNAPVNSPTLVHGGVAPLSTVVTPANVATITAQAQAGKPTLANLNGTVVAASTISGNSTYGGVNGASAMDVVVNGNLTLGAGTRYFKSLYVTGSLTQNGGGTFNASALYVGGTLTITSTSGTCQIGPTYVGGDFQIGGGPLSINTTDWTGAAPYGTTPGPLYVVGQLYEQGGPFTPHWGPTYVAGNVTFLGNSAQIMSPLIVTSGIFKTGGSGSFGTVANPVVVLGLAGSTAGTMQFSSDATFTGVIINMGGGVNLDNDGNTQPPNNYSFFVDGEVMATGQVEFTNNANVGYNPTVLGNLGLTAGTTTTSVVPGTWQQLSPSGS
jgi:Tfp pilus assembly protein PilX